MKSKDHCIRTIYEAKNLADQLSGAINKAQEEIESKSSSVPQVYHMLSYAMGKATSLAHVLSQRCIHYHENKGNK